MPWLLVHEAARRIGCTESWLRRDLHRALSAGPVSYDPLDMVYGDEAERSPLPRTPSALSAWLNKHAAALQGVGIKVALGRHTKTGRTVTIKKV